MSDLRAAAEQALEALTSRDGDGWGRRFARDRAIEALEDALAEQCQCGDRPAAECPGEWEPGCDLGANEAHAKVHEPQEPVAWQWLDTGHFRKKIPRQATPAHWRPLYTAPQRQPLTSDEIQTLWSPYRGAAPFSFARAIERAHGIGGKE